MRSIAGPTELLVVADAQADPEMVALDLAAQAEHGPDSVGAVASPDAGLLDAGGAVSVVPSPRCSVGAARRPPPRLAAERPTVQDAPLALILTPGIDAAVE